MNTEDHVEPSSPLPGLLSIPTPPNSVVPSDFRQPKLSSPELPKSPKRPGSASPVTSTPLPPSSLAMASMASMFPKPPSLPFPEDALHQKHYQSLSHQYLNMQRLIQERSFTRSPPPMVSPNDPTANNCKIVDYRGKKIAAFLINGKTMLCLPQAFELFLKNLVGGLHTVYTKLRRLEITPIVCNVEQTRILRGLGAIQPGVNRCKLLADFEFDELFKDCTTSRPGRPPKRITPITTFAPMTPQDVMMQMKHPPIPHSQAMDAPFAPMDHSPPRHLYPGGLPPHLNPLAPLNPAAVAQAALLSSRNGVLPTQPMPPDFSKGLLDRESFSKGLLERENFNKGLLERENFNKGLLERESFNKGLLERENFSKGLLERENFNKGLLESRDSLLDSYKQSYSNMLKHLQGIQQEQLERESSLLERSLSPKQLTEAPQPKSPPLNLSRCDEDDKSESDIVEKEEEEEDNRSSSDLNMDTDDEAKDRTAEDGPEAAGKMTSILQVMNHVQSLINTAVESAKNEEKQLLDDKSDLQDELTKEKDSLRSLKKQIENEQKNSELYLKRFRKEKRLRRKLKEQLEMESKKTQLLEAALKAVSYETHLQIQASMAADDAKQRSEAAANGLEAKPASPQGPAAGLAGMAPFQMPSLLTTTAR